MTLGTIASTDSRSFDKFKTSAFPPDILMCLDWRRWLAPAETQRQPDAAPLVTKADRPWKNESPHMNAAIPLCLAEPGGNIGWRETRGGVIMPSRLIYGLEGDQ